MLCWPFKGCMRVVNVTSIMHCDASEKVIVKFLS